MNIILLSGGSGKRLWPLSNDIRSKQFLKILKAPDGMYESMMQRAYRQIRKVYKDAKITIATPRVQISSIRNQLGDSVDICLEPCRRDTFPAIVLTGIYLKEIKNISEDEVIIVCPIDQYVEDAYFETLTKMEEMVRRKKFNLALIGIIPTYPSEKYGYIIPETDDNTSKVQTFKEKPNEETAATYIRQGGLWNGGIFAFKLRYLLEKAHEIIQFTDYQDLFARYAELDKISFDYAVSEKEKNIGCLRFSGEWRDLGTWSTLTDVLSEKIIGNGILDDESANVHILNELDVPILCMGLQDAVIAASADGILVSDKESSALIKQYVDKIDQQVMYAEKSWGEFRVLDIAENSMTIKITLKSGQQMNYHSHEQRDEIWNIISGKGRTVVDGMEQFVEMGDVITMQAGCKHTLIADSELKVIEVQMGKQINVNDKQKFELKKDE